MPNTLKYVACCELAARFPSTATQYRGVSRNGRLTCGLPTRNILQTPVNARKSALAVSIDLADPGAISRFTGTTGGFFNRHSRRQYSSIEFKQNPDQNLEGKESSVNIRFTPIEAPATKSSSTTYNAKTLRLNDWHTSSIARRRADPSARKIKTRIRLVKTSEKQHTPEGLSYVPFNRIPCRVKAVVDRCMQSLRGQGRAVSKEAFRFDVKLRLASLFPYHGIPTWWIVSFQELYSKAEEGKLDSWQMPARADTLTVELLEMITAKNTQAFQDAWQKLGGNVKAAQWPLLALWLLRHHPIEVTEFLVRTNSEPHPPFGMVSDCMIYLKAYHMNLVSPEKFKEAIMTCMHPERWPVIVVPQRGVRLFVTHAGAEDVYKAFDTMRSRESQISATTMLAFMKAFINFADVDKALECLRMIPALNTDEGHTLDSEGVHRHCCMLLQLDRVVEEDGERNFKILPQILELGVKPSVPMMNIVLSNAFATGNTHLGLDILGHMKDQGMAFSSYTYLALLKDAVARGDEGQFNLLLRQVTFRDDFKDNKYIISKLLHGRLIFGTSSGSRSANLSGVFLDMLDLYSRHYDLKPLRDLTIIPEYYDNVKIERDVQPSFMVLSIMICAYIRCNANPRRTMRIYKRFRELVAERHPVIAQIVQHPHIFSEFILSFRHPESSLDDCVSIVKDMLDTGTKPFEVEGKLITSTKPTTWTYNTLMSVFVAHGQTDAVQSIRETMENYGIKFDEVTWNTIIYNLVKTQNVGATAAALEDMDADGFAPSSYTVRALRMLNTPGLLQKAMERLNEEAERAFWTEHEAIERENDQLLDEGLKRLSYTHKGT